MTSYLPEQASTGHGRGGGGCTGACEGKIEWRGRIREEAVREDGSRDVLCTGSYPSLVATFMPLFLPGLVSVKLQVQAQEVPLWGWRLKKSLIPPPTPNSGYSVYLPEGWFEEYDWAISVFAIFVCVMDICSLWEYWTKQNGASGRQSWCVSVASDWKSVTCHISACRLSSHPNVEVKAQGKW